MLRLKRQSTWAVIARELDVSEGMVYGVLGGTKHFSDKVVYRLAALERAAGIEPPPLLFETGGSELKDGSGKKEVAKLRGQVQRLAETFQKQIAQIHETLNELEK